MRKQKSRRKCARHKNSLVFQFQSSLFSQVQLPIESRQRQVVSEPLRDPWIHGVIKAWREIAGRRLKRVKDADARRADAVTITIATTQATRAQPHGASRAGTGAGTGAAHDEGLRIGAVADADQDELRRLGRVDAGDDGVPVHLGCR